MISEIIDFLFDAVKLIQNPKVITLVFAIPLFFRILAVLLFVIGKIIPGEDFTENASNWFKRSASHIITAFKWMGIGYTDKTSKKGKKL